MLQDSSSLAHPQHEVLQEKAPFLLVVRAAGVGMGRLGRFEREVPGLDLAPAKLMFRFLNIIPPAKVGELCH
jgi:hypothetical protein